LEPKTPNLPEPEALRCPSCRGRDVVADFPRNFWDEIMRGWGRLPKHCRTCGRRFHVKERRSIH
jgi:hypothetical protein